jgi:hypothetical protein
MALVLVAVLMAWCAVSTARADVQFSIRDGRVVLVANNATIADIMAEWARVGRTKIVNADKIPKDVVTLEFRNVNERQVLDILLRSTSGFIVALRNGDDPNASLFDRIVIMPPSAPPPVVAASATPASRRAPAPDPIAVREPDVAQVESASVPADDPPPTVTTMSALPEPPDSTFTGNARHMMETVNPRDFKLPAGLMSTPTVAVPPVLSSARPGVITQPTPNAP